MRIYLDTNIIVDLGYFRSFTGRQFLKIIKFLGLDVVLSAIVVDEVIGKYRKKLKQLVTEIEKRKTELSKLTDSSVVNNIDIEKEVEDYESWFFEQCDECGISILDYPDTPIERLIKDSYTGIKPFKESGEGHKDYLIWESIKADIETTNNQLNYSLVTNNKSDFFKEDTDKISLHPDLKKQLPDHTSISTFLHYKSFYDVFVEPLLENIEIENIPQLTQEDIYGICTSFIEDQMNGYSTYAFEDVYFRNDVTIMDIYGIECSSLSLLKINNEEISINVSGEFEAYFHGYMDKHEYYGNYDEVKQKVSVYDEDYNDHVMAVEQDGIVPFEVSLVYSLTINKITEKTYNLPSETTGDFQYM
jgi:hypothetical protein